ncbi:hypothetical protein BB561_003683 [Smittium simulii]|uniref:Peroxisomal membrane protein PEX16 n=1 Tax=Smittium simulii TaxID=133385 RepID=A0A2T9YK15_9FUNG|nr:hypothetical protein BB561_003683 [Smittium simulii]
MLSLYESFLIKNAPAINSIENGLKTLTFILPGRFEEAEIASETIYSILNFLGLYHDYILSKAAKNNQLFDTAGQLINVPTSEKLKYFKYFSKNHKVYHSLAILLTSTLFVEKLVEMIVEKKLGIKKKWQAITLLEVVKMVTGSVIPDRLMDPSILANPPIDYVETINSGTWKGKRSNIEYQDIQFIYNSPDKSSSIKTFLESKVKKPDDVASAHDMIRPFSSFGSVGEIAFIIRPLIYVLLIKKLGRKSWTPWAISLIVELTSQKLVSLDYLANAVSSENGFKNIFSWNRPLENEEKSRRSSLFLLYLLRSPMFDRFIE